MNMSVWAEACTAILSIEPPVMGVGVHHRIHLPVSSCVRRLFGFGWLTCSPAHAPPPAPAPQVLSWYPRILVFPNFIDKERAEHIISLVKPRLNPSGLAYRPGERAEMQQQVRTSKGACGRAGGLGTVCRCRALTGRPCIGVGAVHRS